MNQDFHQEIYNKYYRLIYSTCYRKLKDKTLIEDAVQATFLLYLKEKNKSKKELNSWFYWASKNVCTVINRDQKKRANLDGVRLDHDSSDQYSIKLDSLFENLSDRKKEMLILRFYENKTYQEIANEVGLKEDNVRKTIQRTIVSLREKVNKEEAIFLAVLCGLFGGSAIKAEAATVSSLKPFAIAQEHIVKGVQSMLFVTKMKVMSLGLVFLSMPLSGLYFAYEGVGFQMGEIKTVNQEKNNIKNKKEIIEELLNKPVSYDFSNSTYKEMIERLNKDFPELNITFDEKILEKTPEYDKQLVEMTLDGMSLKNLLMWSLSNLANNKLELNFKAIDDGVLIYEKTEEEKAEEARMAEMKKKAEEEIRIKNDEIWLKGIAKILERPLFASFNNYDLIDVIIELREFLPEIPFVVHKVALNHAEQLNKRLTINFKGNTITEILDRVCSEFDVAYQFKNEAIIIVKKEEVSK